MVSTDDGYVVSWTANSLRAKAESAYRKTHSETKAHSSAESKPDEDWERERCKNFILLLLVSSDILSILLSSFAIYLLLPYPLSFKMQSSSGSSATADTLDAMSNDEVNQVRQLLFDHDYSNDCQWLLCSLLTVLFLPTL
jgi:hypothetical protein